eukprot:GEMP01055862.1.p1 GENE.GEMP01055862.1~~GEMP01055862.1.p1  ORF type:complete len:301 (+),score=73.09 GEMP01055862.1:393-1295(+)
MRSDSMYSNRSSRKTLVRAGSQSATSSGNGSTVAARAKLRMSQKTILGMRKASQTIRTLSHLFNPLASDNIPVARPPSSNRNLRPSVRTNATHVVQASRKKTLNGLPSMVKPGQLIARDAFFSFLEGNYLAQCYPPVSASGYSKQECRSGVGMQLCYRDEVSTDECGSDAADMCSDHKETTRAAIRGETMVAAGRCHETTDLTQRSDRKEVELAFCDEMRIVLGDSNWWPGAAGYRLTHEVKTDDASAYVERWAFPRAQLLYAYTQQVSSTEGAGEILAEKPADIEERRDRANVLPPLLK